MATSALRWFQAAILLQILLLAYCLMINIADLSPWNDLAARPADYDLARTIGMHALPQLGFMALFALGIRMTAILSAIGYIGYLGVQLWIWWKPVVLSGGPVEPGLYARTLKLIPHDWLRLAPDAQHLALQALLLLTVFAMVMAIGRMRYL
jgi:hypothetical protein